MSFERLRTNQTLDRALGKPRGASDNPWNPASAGQNDLTELRKKAALVKAGQAMFSREEVQKLLADFVLANE